MRSSHVKPSRNFHQSNSLRLGLAGIAVAAVMALALGTATPGPAYAKPSAPSASSPAPAPVGSAPGGLEPKPTPKSSPVAAARNESWTPTSHSLTADGKTTLDLFAQPVFKRGTDGWKTIDSSISVGSDSFPFEALGLANPVHFGSSASALIKIDTVSGPVLFGLEGATINPPKLNEGVITYSSIFPGVDLEFRTEGGRIGKRLILANKSARSKFRFTIADPDHILGKPKKREADAWTFSAQVAFATGIELPSPAAWTESDKGPGLPGSAHQKVAMTSPGYSIDLSVDRLWAKTARYPLALDPAVEWTDETWTDDAGLAVAFGPTGATDCDGEPCQLADPVDGRVAVGHFDLNGLGEKSFLTYVGANVDVLADRQVSSAVLGGYEYSISPTVNELCSTIGTSSTGADLANARCGKPAKSTRQYATWPEFGWFTDVTASVRAAVKGAGHTGSTAGFAIDADAGDPDGAGAISSPGLRLIYTGYPVPRPLTVGQTFGCDCWAGHSSGNQAMAADPVNTATGALMEKFTDLSVTAPGQSIDLTRTYNSLDTSSGAFGPGWSFSYSSSLAENAPGELTFTDGSGTRTRFGAIQGGGYAPIDPAVSASLSDGPNGTHVMRNLSGDTMSFDATGVLISAADERGQGLTFAYNAGTLTTVTDLLGQTLAFAWAGTGVNHRIVSATTTDGRSVGYAYSDIAGASRLTGTTAVDGATTTYGYSSGGAMSSITDPLGHVSARNTYDSAGRITSQRDQTGAKTTFAWNPATQTATVTDPTGRVRRDIYSNLNLIKQIDGNGAVNEQLYDGDDNPAAFVDAADRLYRNEYDDRDRLVLRVAPAPLNYTESWTYDASDHVTSHTDPEGFTTSYTYNSAGLLTSVENPDSGTNTNTYTSGSDGSPSNLLATSTDPLGRTTTYAYDSAGNQVAVTSPGGHTTALTYDSEHRITSTTSPSGAVNQWTYDAAGRVLTTTDPAGAVTTNTYDSAGRLTKTTDPLLHTTTYGYDSANRLIRTSQAGGRTTETSYDASGRVATTTDPMGSITTYVYDPAGRLTGTTDALGRTTTRTYDTTGKLSKVTDPTGGETTYTYDVVGHMTSTTDADGVTQDTTYDRRGQVTAVTDALGGFQGFGYDSMGRKTSAYDSDGVYTSNYYDLAGQLLTQSRPRSTDTYIPNYWEDRITYTYDADGNRVSTVDPRGNVPGANPIDFTTTVDYDADGHPTVTTDPLGRKVGTTYDVTGRPTKVTDSAGGVTTTAYNKIGWPISVTSPGAAKTSYVYDGLGNLTKRLDPLAHATTYTYDKAGQLLTQTDALGRRTTMSYDAVGNVTKLVKPSGTATVDNPNDGTVSNTYDAANRLTVRSFSDLTAAFKYGYSAAGRQTTALREQNGSVVASSSYVYDKTGRTTSIVRTGADNGTTNYSYTGAGRLSGTAWSTGMAAAYSYNAVGQIANLTPSGTGDLPAINYGYDPSGRISNVTRGGQGASTSTLSTYDGAGQLTSLTHSIDSSVLDAYDITRDTRGNPTKVKTTAAGVTNFALYGYDSVSRLTSECYPTAGATCANTAPKTSYTYDKVGNRKTQSVRTTTGTNVSTISTAYTYDAGDQFVSQAVDGTTTMTNTWSPNGAMATSTTPDGTTSYTTDLTDELVSADTASGSHVEYTHDANGNRTSRSVGSVTDAVWTWDELSGLPTRTGEYDATGSLTKSWLPDPVSATGTALAEVSGATGSWLLGDPFSNIAAAVDTTSSTVSGTRTVNAFGGARAAATGSMVDSVIGFEGQYFESATNLYDMRARDYDPSSGLFRSNDPVQIPAGMPYVSGYSYALNNPLTRTDASGNWSTSDWEQLGKFVFAQPIAAFQIVQGAVHAVSPVGMIETGLSVNRVYNENGGGWSGIWATANVHFNPMYGAVAAGFGAYDNCVSGKPGDAAIDLFTALDVTAMTAATARGVSRYGVSGIAPKSVAYTAEDVLRPEGTWVGNAGQNGRIRVVTGGLAEAESMFSKLAQGGTIVDQNIKLVRVELPSGGFVQLRTEMSKSPGVVATIDVDIPGISIKKVKFNP